MFRCCGRPIADSLGAAGGFIYGESVGGVFGLLLENVVTALREQAVSQLAWLSSAEWVNAQLPHSAFEQVDEIETYAATKLITLNGTARNIRIRPVELADFPKLAALEAIAFDPIWRHSADGLRLLAPIAAF